MLCVGGQARKPRIQMTWNQGHKTPMMASSAISRSVKEYPIEIALSGLSEIQRKLKGVKFQGGLWENEVSEIKKVSSGI